MTMQTVTQPPDNAADPLPRRFPPLDELSPQEQVRYRADLAEQAALRGLPPAA
jgi:hypothetical protein